MQPRVKSCTVETRLHGWLGWHIAVWDFNMACTWLALDSESPSLAMVLELEESRGFPFWCFHGFPVEFAATRQEMCGFTDLDCVAVHLQPPMESILFYPISALYKFLQIPKMKFLVRYNTAIKGVGVSIYSTLLYYISLSLGFGNIAQGGN